VYVRTSCNGCGDELEEEEEEEEEEDGREINNLPS
jgi:hypothetical protein